MKILDYESFINEDADTLADEEDIKFLKNLKNANSKIEQLKMFLEYHPEGFQGEDFYGGPGTADYKSTKYDLLNDASLIINDLIEAGFMKFEDERDPSGTILLTDLGILAARWKSSLEDFYSRYRGTITGKKFNI